MKFLNAAKHPILWVVLAVAMTAVAEDSFFDRELDSELLLLRSTTDRPEAFVHLYAIQDLVDFARFDGRIPDVLTEVCASPEASPLLKGYSLWFLRDVDLRRGNLDEARRKETQLGFVRDWFIIGPFDNEGMAGFDIVYPPEETIDLTQTYSGKERPVAWQEYPKVSPDCYIDLAATLRPVSQTLAYALACVFSPERQPVAIRVGADDCAKAWVGQELVEASRDCHPLGFDQLVAPAVLDKGWNRLLLKVCQKEDAWGFQLRLTAPDGSPLSSLRCASERDELAGALESARGIGSPSADSSVPESPSVVADPVAEFERLVRANPDDAGLHASLSFLLEHAKAFDRNERADRKELETAASLSPNEWKYHFRLGELYEDENKKRASYEKAVELNPEYAPAYSRLGEHYSAKNLERKSLWSFRRAIEKDPSYYPAALGLSKYLNDSSQKPEAARMFRDLLNTYPNTPFLLSQAATFTPSPVTPEKTQERFETALRFNFCDLDLRDALLSKCYERFDFDGATHQLDVIERISPVATSVLVDHARLLGDRARYDEATVLIDRALGICPEDDLALKQKGELLLQQGEREEALEWFEKSLAIRPQNRPLREYIEFLKPKEKAFEDEFKVDAAELIKTTSFETGDGTDSAAYLLDLSIREIHPNGLSNSYHQEVVRILSEAGLNDFRARRAIYRPSVDEVQVKEARVFKKDGRVIAADGPFTFSIAGEYKMYYDLEAKFIRFSNLEPGDTIEFSYRTNALAPRNMYGDYFGDIVYFKDTSPKKTMQYVVISPPGRDLFYNAVGMDLQPVIESRRNGKVYVWRTENVPKIESEPYMPGYTEVLPYVHVSTYKDWESVGEWYWNLIRDQFLLDAGARAEVARVTRDLKTEREKITAIYNYVVQNTRYIGLEFGIHSHKPYPAYKVYARKFGDCKDKAGLMIAMLKEIGVDACMAAVRMKSRGRVEPQPASLAVFNHAICYVPKYDMWLDGTAEYSGTDEFPYEDQGVEALVVGKGVRKFVTTPVLAGEQNLISDTYDARILPDGGIEFELSREASGQYASYFRSTYQEEKERKNDLEQNWGRALPNIKISGVKFENLKELDKPVRYVFKASAPNYVLADERGSMGFSGVIRELSLTQRYAALSKRKYDLVLSFPWSQKISIAYKLPPGYAVASLPENMHLETDFGKCDAQFTSDDAASIAVSFSFSFDVDRVTAEQYGAFREFCRVVDEKQAEKIRIAR